MAKPLVLQIGEKELPFQLSKIDRSLLYGYVDTETLDEQGRQCKLVTLAGDGKTLVGSGSVAMAYLSPNGEWRDKASLTPVDMDGTEIQPVPSSFKAPVVMDQKVEIDEYLSHNIRSLYLLTCEEDMGDLLKELRGGAIYSFPFSYRGSLEADTAFMLEGSDGNIFLAIGKKTDIKFVGFEQSAEIETAEDEDDDDDMDFGMM